MMARIGAVTAVVLGTFLALTQFEVALATPVSANVHSTGHYNSGAAQSQVIENDGTIKGECAYIGPQGDTIKIKYTKPPNGQLIAEASHNNVDPVAALATCRKSADAAAATAQQSIKQVEEMIRQQQQQFQAMQQRFLPNFYGFHNQFQFPGFGQF